MGTHAPIDVVYDAECDLCRRARAWVERRDVEDCVRFVAVDSSVPVCRRVLEAGDGTAREEGFGAWLAILERLPRWRLLASLLRTAPLTWIGGKVYAFVAAHRRSL